MPSARSAQRTFSQRTIHPGSVRNAHLAARHLQVPPPTVAAFATLGCCTSPMAAGPSFQHGSTFWELKEKKHFLQQYGLTSAIILFYLEAFEMFKNLNSKPKEVWMSRARSTPRGHLRKMCGTGLGLPFSGFRCSFRSSTTRLHPLVQGNACIQMPCTRHEMQCQQREFGCSHWCV